MTPHEAADVGVLVAENARLKALLDTAERFFMGHDKHRGRITVEARGKGMWCVTNGSAVLATDGEWEWEPQPSSRDEDFIKRTRFTFDEALERARATLTPRGEGD